MSADKPELFGVKRLIAEQNELEQALPLDEPNGKGRRSKRRDRRDLPTAMTRLPNLLEIKPKAMLEECREEQIPS
jgi:hypothetical protein